MRNITAKVVSIGGRIHGVATDGRRVLWSTQSLDPSCELTAIYAAEDWISRQRERCIRTIDRSRCIR